MEGRKSEDEKNEAALACDVFESSNAKLPKNVFRSSFTWYCYEVINRSAFHIWLLLCLTLIVGWKVFSGIGGRRPSDSNMDGPQTKHKRNPGFFEASFDHRYLSYIFSSVFLMGSFQNVS